MRFCCGALLILFIAASFPLSAARAATQATPTSDPEVAETLYRNGDYSAAISVYEQILQQIGSSGEILYNLGNCYYKLGQYGRAILYYERARKFLAGDSDLRTNLKLANLRIYDRIEPLPRIFVIRIFEGVAELFSIRRWALLFLLTEWGLLISLTALHIVRKPRWRRIFVGAFVMVAGVAVLSGVFFVQQKVQNDRRVEGIVLAQKVEARSAPESGSVELFILHEGVKVRVLRQVSGWAEIRLADGKRGWMPSSAFEVI